MENKRTAAFAFAVTALMLLTSVACVPMTTADADTVPPVGLYRNETYISDAMLQDASFKVNTTTKWDTEQHKVVTMAKAGSYIPVNGAQLWVNGLPNSDADVLKVSVLVAFDPLGTKKAPVENTTGDWLLEAGLKFSLLQNNAVVASATLVQGDNLHESGTVSFGDLVKGGHYDIKLELDSDIELSEVQAIQNMRFTFYAGDADVKITFKNGDNVLKIEVASDEVIGPSEKPTKPSEQITYVFVGWNSDSEIDPKYAEWVQDMDYSAQATDVTLNAIFAERGDMNGDKVLDDDDAIYLLYHYLFEDDPDFAVRQNPNLSPEPGFDDDDAIRLLYHYLFPDDPDFDLYDVEDD